jgi:drug/metabolite transporter (DMT)-like permease
MNIGVLLSILSLFTMSVAPVMNKFASTHLSWAWGAALSSLFCFAICFIAQPRAMTAVFRGRTLISKSLLLIALTNSAGLLCQYGAVVRLDPPTLSILGRMYVVFAILLAQFILKERCTRIEGATFALVFSGAMLFCWNSSLGSDWIGIGLCLAYCFFFALTHMQVKVETSKTSANAILLANNFLSSLFLLPLAYKVAGPIPSTGASAVLLILGAAFFGQWLGLLLFYESLKRIPLVRANLIRTFSPIAGVLVSLPFFPLEITRLQFAGAAVMILALIGQALAKYYFAQRALVVA